MKKFFILMLSVSLMYGCSSGDEGSGTDDTTIIDDDGNNDNEPYVYTYEDILNKNWQIMQITLVFEDPTIEMNTIRVFQWKSECVYDTRLKFDNNGLATHTVWEKNWDYDNDCQIQPDGSRYFDEERTFITSASIVNNDERVISFNLSNGRTAMLIPNSIKRMVIEDNTEGRPLIDVFSMAINYFPENLYLTQYDDNQDFLNSHPLHKVKEVRMSFLVRN